MEKEDMRELLDSLVEIGSQLREIAELLAAQNETAEAKALKDVWKMQS